jgi:hypothetical protein
MSGVDPARPQVIAVLDDAAAGTPALELASALAQSRRRDLGVVYVESTRSLVAAALPITQVLARAGSAWVDLRTADVEQGFRAHAERLRELAARAAVRHSVQWSLRVMRGSLAAATTELWAESDLLLLARAPSSPAPGTTRQRPHRPVIAVVSDRSEAGERATGAASELARALGGQSQVCRVDAAAQLGSQATALAALARSDVIVLPRMRLDPAELAAVRCPVLLVG